MTPCLQLVFKHPLSRMSLWILYNLLSFSAVLLEIHVSWTFHPFLLLR
jgi:hypothetical protein